MQTQLKSRFDPKEYARDDSHDPLNGLKQNGSLSIPQLYRRNVQRLYSYGMYSCNNCEVVKDVLVDLFINVRDHREVMNQEGLISLYLFKSFRGLLLQKIFAGREERPNGFRTKKDELDRRRREAIFLKFEGRFSYFEIATIMDIKMESAYDLVAQAVGMVRPTAKE